MELDQLIVRLHGDAAPLTRTLQEVDKEASRTLGGISRWSMRLGEGFVRAAVDGRSLSAVLRDMAKDLAAASIRSAVTGPLGSALGSAVGNVLGNVLGSVFGRAGGGSVNPATPYLVGERGPELFVPHSAGRIDPTPAGSAAPVSVSISIDARGAQADTASRLQALAGEIQKRTFDAVFAAMERGGRYARISGRR